MGRGVVYCDVCGERLLARVFDEGKALEASGRIYCIKCAEEKGIKVSKPVSPRPGAVRATAKKKNKHSTRRLQSYRPMPPQKKKAGNNT